ncbi:MAG: hypothetical protein ACLR8L_14820 [Oscillospiraceae bacterium]
MKAAISDIRPAQFRELWETEPQKILLPEEYLLYSTDFKTHDKQNFQSIVYDLAAELNVEERYIQYNWVLLDAIGISYDEATSSDAGSGFPL